MLAAIIVKAFVSVIGVAVGLISLFGWLNMRQNRDYDRIYRGELDTERALRYAVHQVV